MKRILATFAAVLMLAIAAPASAQEPPVDFTDLYPGTDGTTYLTGTNYAVVPPSSAVLWMDIADRGWWYLFNSNPASESASCHWDRFRWHDELRYYQTHHSCGDSLTSVIYPGGVVYLPATWVGGPWTRSGSTPAWYFVDGDLVCIGTLEWTAEVLGVVELAPGVDAVWTRTTQTTTWTDGPGDPVTGCAPGATARYQDHHFWTDRLARSVGGNLDRHDAGHGWDWDVWFDGWAPMP